MYVPKHFAMSDEDVQELLHRHGAGELVTYSAGTGLSATLMPFYFEPGDGTLGTLHGHVARPNDHWRQEVVGEALVLLRGPDGYISPGWYASKREHGRVVPTWDYLTLHVYGTLRARDDAGYVRWVVEHLTAKHEAASEHPWSVSDAPEKYVEGQLRAIVGMELQITRIEAKAKASQNRPADDIDGVVAGLRTGGHDALAAEVARLAPRS